MRCLEDSLKLARLPTNKIIRASQSMGLTEDWLEMARFPLVKLSGSLSQWDNRFCIDQIAFGQNIYGLSQWGKHDS